MVARLKPRIEEDIPEHWGDLSPEVRAAIVVQARDRIWWDGLKTRVRGLGPWASWLTVVIGAAVLFMDQIIHVAAWLAGNGGGKP